MYVEPEEYEYDLSCDVCESELTLIVKHGNGELPTHCPMCGTPQEGGEWG